MSSGRRAWWLATTGRLEGEGAEEWRDEFYYYSQPQVGKLLIGAAQAVAGVSGEAPIYDYDWQRPLVENAAAGRVPEPRAVLAGRVPGAVLGWAGCLALWWLTAALGAPGAGPLAALLLASHPLWLANARRAGLDVPALTLGLTAAGAALRAVRQRSLSWWALAGVLAGLSVGTKYVGLLPALAAAPPLLAAVRRRGSVVRVVVGALLAAGAAALVFLGTNPALWVDPWKGVNVSLGFLSGQAEAMRHTVPEFKSPLWVAAQMVDRVFWPLGGPRVVERSMPEPLTPGTYGTPIVALGVLLALLELLRARRRPTVLPAPAALAAALAAGWCALVFIALAVSLPTWWERWHLPLVPPLVLLGAVGLEWLTRASGARNVVPLGWALAGAQYVAALALLPSYLGKGFGQLVVTPVGAMAHLAALAWTLVTLVSLALPHYRAGREKKQDGGAEEGG